MLATDIADAPQVPMHAVEFGLHHLDEPITPEGRLVTFRRFVLALLMRLAFDSIGKMLCPTYEGLNVAAHFSAFDGTVHWVDDLLGDADFNRVVEFAAASTFVPADEQNKTLIWAQNNRASPSMAHNIVWPEFMVHQRFMAAIPGISVYPSGSPLDIALKTIRDVSLETGTAGKMGRDWIGIISTVFKYDSNAGLIFHTDATGYSGAFTYYLNREWDSDWGGHLMFTRDDPRKIRSGKFLTPLPNRLVLLQAGVPHSISTVAAPDGVSRLALSGFYLRPERIAEIIKFYLPK